MIPILLVAACCAVPLLTTDVRFPTADPKAAKREKAWSSQAFSYASGAFTVSQAS